MATQGGSARAQLMSSPVEPSMVGWHLERGWEPVLFVFEEPLHERGMHDMTGLYETTAVPPEPISPGSCQVEPMSMPDLLVVGCVLTLVYYARGQDDPTVAVPTQLLRNAATLLAGRLRQAGLGDDQLAYYKLGPDGGL